MTTLSFVSSERGSGSVKIVTEPTETDNITVKTPLESGMMCVYQDTSLMPVYGKTCDIGSSNKKFNFVYANALKTTSDERRKSSIAPIPDKVLDIWEKIEYKEFFLKEEENGITPPKVWFGVIAQQVIKAFEDEGIDPFEYGIVFKEKDDTYTVSYNQVFVLESALMRRKIKRLEEKLG